MHRARCRRREGGGEGQRVAGDDRVGRCRQRQRCRDSIGGEGCGDSAGRAHGDRTSAGSATDTTPAGEAGAAGSRGSEGDRRVIGKTDSAGDATGDAVWHGGDGTVAALVDCQGERAVAVEQILVAIIAGGEVEIAIVVEVAPRHTSGGIVAGTKIDGGGEGTSAVVEINDILSDIAGGEVEVAVAVKVAPGEAEGVIAATAKVDPGAKGAIAVVGIDFTLVCIVGSGEVEVAVVVEVAPGYAGRVVAAGAKVDRVAEGAAAVIEVDFPLAN